MEEEKIPELSANDVPATELVTSDALPPPRKKARYSRSSHRPSRARFWSSGPFLGFEDEQSTPTQPPPFCVTLSLDDRFFPEGIQPGHIVEVKGDENSGKTFLLTYLIARFLVWYPTKTAVLIDTSQKFSLQNLIALLKYYIAKKLKSAPTVSTPLPQLVNNSPELTEYLDRLLIIKCYTAEELMVTVTIEENTLQQMISANPDINLVTIDTVNNFSFTESKPRNANIEILSSLRQAVSKMRTPIICTAINCPYNYQKVKKNPPGTSTTPIAVEENATPWYSNITVDPSVFTHSMFILLAAHADKVNVRRSHEFKDSHYATAYLRSKHKANMAGSAIHRVKFSIFSDMLWVVP